MKLGFGSFLMVQTTQGKIIFLILLATMWYSSSLNILEDTGLIAESIAKDSLEVDIDNFKARIDSASSDRVFTSELFITGEIDHTLVARSLQSAVEIGNKRDLLFLPGWIFFVSLLFGAAVSMDFVTESISSINRGKLTNWRNGLCWTTNALVWFTLILFKYGDVADWIRK